MINLANVNAEATAGHADTQRIRDNKLCQTSLHIMI